jgi:threonine dehydratase
MVAVSENAIKRTMFFLWERMKIVVEPTGVLAAAALLEGVVTASDARIGVTISGGNVDLRQASRIFSQFS